MMAWPEYGRAAATAHRDSFKAEVNSRLGVVHTDLGEGGQTGGRADERERERESDSEQRERGKEREREQRASHSNAELGLTLWRGGG